MHKTMETELILLTGFRNSAPRCENAHWLHHRCMLYGRKQKCAVSLAKQVGPTFYIESQNLSST